MSKAAKALIITWVLIGLLIAGGIGFYLGRTTVPKGQGQSPGMQNQDELRGGQQPTGVQQPLQGGSKQQPGANREGPAPSGPIQQGQPSVQR